MFKFNPFTVLFQELIKCLKISNNLPTCFDQLSEKFFDNFRRSLKFSMIFQKMCVFCSDNNKKLHMQLHSFIKYCFYHQNQILALHAHVISFVSATRICAIQCAVGFLIMFENRTTVAVKYVMCVVCCY